MHSADFDKKSNKSNFFVWLKAFLIVGLILFFYRILQNAGFAGRLNFSSSNLTLGISFLTGVAASVSSCLAVVGAVVMAFAEKYETSEDKNFFSAAVKPNLLFHLGRLATFFVLGGALGLVGGKINKLWVSDIAMDPDDGTVYASTRGNGVLKSENGGILWQEINNGLPVNDIRSLAIDPKTPKILYAGTSHEGLVKTVNGGKDWVRLTGYPLLSMAEIAAAFSAQDRSRKDSVPPSIPPEFFKCNQCHGWSDPFLNLKNTYWRVPPNRRDWKPTVDRMSIRARLTPEESKTILDFLTTYTRSATRSSESDESPQWTVSRICGRCHALEIQGRCAAGDCKGDRVVRLLKPPPWDFAVDWMKSMGARMTETEQQTIQAHLQKAYPAKPYILRWEKVPAPLGEGGWNVVTLKEHGDYLYAGLEGSGKIYRSAQGLNWEEVANTHAYTAYAVTIFKGSLYAGTNNPNPQIWSSADGKHWKPVGSLPSEEKGVFSLGVFQDHLYAGGGRARIYRSGDGKQWSPVGDLKQAELSSFNHWVRFLVPFKGHLYAGIERGPLYRSSDGIRWDAMDPQITKGVGVRGAAVFKDALYVGTTGGGEIWRTEDGLHWRSVFKAPSHTSRGYVASMAVAGDSLFAGIDGYVFQTGDGLSWEEAGHLGPFTIEALSGFQGALYAGTLIPPSGQIYRANLGHD